MVLMNIWHFVDRLGGMKPVFHIDVLLANSDIVLYPTTGDLYKWMIQTIRGCTDRLVFHNTYFVFINNSLISLRKLAALSGLKDKGSNVDCALPAVVLTIVHTSLLCLRPEGDGMH